VSYAWGEKLNQWGKRVERDAKNSRHAKHWTVYRPCRGEHLRNSDAEKRGGVNILQLEEESEFWQNV